MDQYDFVYNTAETVVENACRLSKLIENIKQPCNVHIQDARDVANGFFLEFDCSYDLQRDTASMTINSNTRYLPVHLLRGFSQSLPLAIRLQIAELLLAFVQEFAEFTPHLDEEVLMLLKRAYERRAWRPIAWNDKVVATDSLVINWHLILKEMIHQHRNPQAHRNFPLKTDFEQLLLFQQKQVVYTLRPEGQSYFWETLNEEFERKDMTSLVSVLQLMNKQPTLAAELSDLKLFVLSDFSYLVWRMMAGYTKTKTIPPTKSTGQRLAKILEKIESLSSQHTVAWNYINFAKNAVPGAFANMQETYRIVHQKIAPLLQTLNKNYCVTTFDLHHISSRPDLQDLKESFTRCQNDNDLLQVFNRWEPPTDVSMSRAIHDEENNKIAIAHPVRVNEPFIRSLRRLNEILGIFHDKVANRRSTGSAALIQHGVPGNFYRSGVDNGQANCYAVATLFSLMYYDDRFETLFDEKLLNIHALGRTIRGLKDGQEISAESPEYEIIARMNPNNQSEDPAIFLERLLPLSTYPKNTLKGPDVQARVGCSEYILAYNPNELENDREMLTKLTSMHMPLDAYFSWYIDSFLTIPNAARFVIISVAGQTDCATLFRNPKLYLFPGSFMLSDGRQLSLQSQVLLHYNTETSYTSPRSTHYISLVQTPLGQWVFHNSGTKTMYFFGRNEDVPFVNMQENDVQDFPLVLRNAPINTIFQTYIPRFVIYRFL